jgi:hypothetical protein
MALNKPIKDKKSGESRRELCLLLDSKQAAEFIQSVLEINSGIPVTEHTYRGKNENLRKALKGKTKISARTKFEVAVYDKNGQKLEDIPNFFPESKGTAQMIVQPYTESENGGSINLVSVIIHSVEGGQTALTKEEKIQRVNELREAAVRAATGG